MSVPTDRKYLATHEWHYIADGVAAIGITQFAADELTDITFVKLPAVGDKVVANKPFGEIESVKATSDLISGVSGEIIAVNDELSSNPGMVNQDPFDQGWMIKIRMTNPADAAKLLSPEAYLKATGH